MATTTTTCTSAATSNSATTPSQKVQVFDTVTVASIQMSSTMGAVSENIKKMTQLAKEAVHTRGAKFLVFPETCITGYISQDLKTNWRLPGRPMKKAFTNSMDPTPFAETVPGPSTNHFCALSKELNCYITVPLIEVFERELDSDEEAEEREKMTMDENGVWKKKEEMEEGHSNDGTDIVEKSGTQSSGEGEGDATKTEKPHMIKRHFFNTVCLAAPDGSLAGHYRKNMPWPYPEQSWATKGQHECVVQTPYGKVGLAICFDIHSILKKYDRHKIWALLYPIAWVGEPIDWFRGGLPKRLQEVNCPHYIIGCNWSTDRDEMWEGAGISTHYGPQGEILASTNKDLGSVIIYSSIPTQPFMDPAGSPSAGSGGEGGAGCSSQGKIGRLNLDKYAAWTEEQLQSQDPKS